MTAKLSFKAFLMLFGGTLLPSVLTGLGKRRFFSGGPVSTCCRVSVDSRSLVHVWVNELQEHQGTLRVEYAYELRRPFAWVHLTWVPQAALRMPADQASTQRARLQTQATAIGALSEWERIASFLACSVPATEKGAVSVEYSANL